jgi:hypothetical protein
VVDPAVCDAFIWSFPAKLRHARLAKNEAFFALVNPHIRGSQFLNKLSQIMVSAVGRSGGQSCTERKSL